MGDPVRPAYIHPTATVEDGAVLGAGTQVWHQAQVRAGARVGADCVLGKGAFVDLDVTVGARCKLQNYANVFHGSVLEDEVFIGPLAVLTNDRFPRAATPDGGLKSDDDWIVEGITVRHGASIGARAVVLPGVTVGRWAIVGAGAVVLKDVEDHRVVAGNPARPLSWAGRCGHVVSDEAWAGATDCPRCGLPLR
ncbi:MAG: N-acetyltransferase [Actinomycetota bacterium]|nr:N-acetyltransferase [Actinomycetota bacterium]